MTSPSSARDRCLDIPELSNELASMLSLQDFAVCMQVCRRWQQLWVRHLFVTSYGPAQAPYFPRHGHHVQTLDWRKTFLPEELDLPRIHCGNLKIILLPGIFLTWNDFWIHFLGLDPQAIPTSPSLQESPNDDDLVGQLELGDKEPKEWGRELSSLKGKTNAFLSDSIEVISLRTPFAPLILGSLTSARVLGDDVLPNLKELTMTGKSALKPGHILAFLDAFPSLERLNFSNINLIHDGDDSRRMEPCLSCPLSYAMSQTTSNLSELSLPQIDSLLALSQVLRLVPRLQCLTLQQTWYSASVLQVVQLSCPDLHALHLYSRTHSSDKVPPSAFLPSWPSSLSPRGDSLGVDSLNGFQKLKTLRLMMANITDQGLAFLLSGMSRHPASSSSFSSTSQLRECMYFYRRLGLEDQLYRGLRTVPEWRPSWQSIRYLVNTCSWLQTLRIIGEMKLPVDVFAPLSHGKSPSWACAKSLELLIIRVNLRGIKENRILQRNLATLKNLRHLAIAGIGILPEALVDDPNETEAEGDLRLPLWPHMKELSMGFDTDRQMSEQQLKLLLDMAPKVKSLDIDAGVTSSASKWIQINRPDLHYRLVCRGG